MKNTKMIESNASETISAFRVFLVFLKIGLFVFGGGYAMIPVFIKEFSEKRKIFSSEEIAEVVTICRSTPGVIAINMATFVGKKTAGVKGSLAAVFGLVFPSFLMVLLLSFVYRPLVELRLVRFAFYGVRAGVLALILNAGIRMFKAVKKNVFSYVILAAAFVCVVFLGVSPIIVLASAGAAGILLKLIIDNE